MTIVEIAVVTILALGMPQGRPAADVAIDLRTSGSPAPSDQVQRLTLRLTNRSRATVTFDGIGVLELGQFWAPFDLEHGRPVNPNASSRVALAAGEVRVVAIDPAELQWGRTFASQWPFQALSIVPAGHYDAVVRIDALGQSNAVPVTIATPAAAIPVFEPFQSPRLVLEGRLADTFSFGRCEYISGMTCRVTLKRGATLPSQVYSAEYDNSGTQVSPRVRLIYPNLKPGESGYATFRLRSGTPARLVLSGEWTGPWKDPY